MVFARRARSLLVIVAGLLCVLLVWAPAACAATGGGALLPVGFLGLPSLHEIIEAIAKGFFSALAGALVPGFLRHGTVATIQRLVALPDPAGWGHVGELEGDMTFLGMSLMPVTLTVCTLRYWVMGLTGAAHPVSALGRCGWATGVLVIYPWLIEQTVAATNTLTHAILGFPVVANGLASIITVLFGGALLIGAGGVFGAFLVIVGVVFAAGLFACAEALTVLLALVFCAGPLFIALAPIPELSHLARVWGHALIAIVLVPIGWTILFATAGALTLDATSVTHGAGGLPGHVAAAFAGLITFILAVKLPLMLFGELRYILGGTLRGGSTANGSQSTSAVPGAERVRAAHARLRSFAVEGVPALGRSAGRAAGALGAPEGGPLGAARRSLVGATRRTGLVSGVTPAVAGASAAGGVAGAGGRVAARGGGVRARLGRAGSILAGAPSEVRAAMTAGSSRTARAAVQRRARATGARGAPAGRKPARAAGRPAQGGQSGTVAANSRERASGKGRASAQTTRGAQSAHASTGPSGRSQSPPTRPPKTSRPGGKGRQKPLPRSAARKTPPASRRPWGRKKQ